MVRYFDRLGRILIVAAMLIMFGRGCYTAATRGVTLDTIMYFVTGSLLAVAVWGASQAAAARRAQPATAPNAIPTSPRTRR